MKIGNIAISAAYLGEKVLTAIAVGATKVWEGVGKYIKFKDPAVEQLCMKWSSDRIGLTPEDAAKVTDIGTTFRKKTKITSFDEFKKFGVTYLGSYAFQNCSSLTSVTIPNSVMFIGSFAFQNCSRLTSVTIGNGVTDIGDYAFEGCSSLTSVTIPNSVTRIGNGAFEGCSSLTSVTIPNSVTRIENYAFYDCSSLTSVTIPNSVERIGGDAFRYCSSLTSVTIGNGVTDIGSDAFYGTANMKYIICRPTTPPTLGSTYYSYNCPIYVPDESVEAYKRATNWSALADRIKPLSEFVEPTIE